MMANRRLAAACAQWPGAAAAGTGHRPCSVPGRLDCLLLEGLPLRAANVAVYNAMMAPQHPAPQASLDTGSTVLFDLDLGPQAQNYGSSLHRTSDRHPIGLCSADRSFSDLDSYRDLKERAGTTTEDLLLQLVLPHTDVELAVAEHLRHLRSVRAMATDTEELAAEMLAMGLLVQVRQGRTRSEAGPRSGRECLRTLRHTFMVCTGYQRGGEATLFNEPLVVEPRFKEQFVIAHPTAEYAQLLQVLPVSFVGTVSRLEAAVRLLAEQVAQAFRQEGRSLPPWRTAEAMMSKWAPAQLSELTRMMNNSSNSTTVAVEDMTGHVQAAPPPVQVQYHQQGHVMFAGTPVGGLQRLGLDRLQATTGVQGAQQAFQGQIQLQFVPPQHQQGVVVSAARSHSASQQQLHQSVALEVVKSMSRQMSSTGMCAHSVPETQAALMQADSLRRSLCGVRPESLHVGAGVTGSGSTGGAVWSPVAKGYRSAGYSSAAQVVTGSDDGSVEHHVAGGASHGSCSVVQLLSSRIAGAAGEVGQQAGEGQGGATGARKTQSVFLAAVQEVAGQGVPAGVLPSAAVGPASTYMVSVGPASGTINTTDRSAPCSGPVSSTTTTTQPGRTEEQVLGMSPNARTHMHIHTAVVHADGVGAGATDDLDTSGLSVDRSELVSGTSATMLLSPQHTPLKIVRQSSSDLKQAVRQARAQTRSALAAALKAAASAPSSASQDKEGSFLHMPHGLSGHALLQGHHINQQGEVVVLGNGGAAVTPGMRLGVRKGREEVWPPRITTVKWGGQNR